MGEWPPLLKYRQMKITVTVRRDGFTQYRVRFNWTPNEESQGYLLVPDGKGKKPAVITVYYEPEKPCDWGSRIIPTGFCISIDETGICYLIAGNHGSNGGRYFFPVLSGY